MAAKASRKTSTNLERQVFSNLIHAAIMPSNQRSSTAI
jgi:hypothetical protein